MAQQADERPAEPPPAPRGSSPTPSGRSRFRVSPFWIVIFLVALGLNLFISTRAMKKPESRVRVPYSPFFPQQVTSSNVEEITSKGTDIQGTFKKNVTFEDEKPTTRFRTEIPAFANTDELSRLLQENDVTVNAEPLETGAPWWQTLLFGFGPTILFVFLLFWLFRRAGNVQSALGAFGRSRARRYEPTGDKVTFADVAGIEEAKDELREVVDFLRNPEKYRRPGGRIPHGVLLSGPPGTGRRCSPAPWPARQACPSTRWRRPSSSRRSSASARPGCATCSSRRRRTCRRSSSSTSSTPSARAYVGRRRVQRRQRRTRADPQPDPDRDGRVRHGDERDRHRGDESA